MADNEPPPSGAGDAAFAAALRNALARAAAAGVLADAAAPDQLLDRLVRAAARAIPSPEGALLLVDAAAKALRFEVVIGQTAATVKDLAVPLGKGIAGLVAVSGQPLAIANAQQDPRHARDIAEQSGYLPTTILAVPVADADGGVVGVLELLDRQGQPTYSLADMELLGRFGELCALALEQRRTRDVHAALVGRSLAALGGLPEEARRGIAARLETFTVQAAADPAARRAMALAERVATIAARGEAEQRACEAILDAFAGYLRESPTPGAGLATLEAGIGVWGDPR